jgi:valyl-tRNA synthetase
VARACAPGAAVIQTNGALKPVTFGSDAWPSHDTSRGAGRLRPAANLSVTKARTKIVELLRESGDLIGDPRPITHPVKFYEKGDRPLEIVTSRQWFIKTMEFRAALLRRNRELKWHPEYMAHRLENWVKRPVRRLVRQPAALLRRAVPGVVSARSGRRHRLHQPLLPEEAHLPIDPSSDVPPVIARSSAASRAVLPATPT